MMKLALILLLNSMVSISAFAQSITCNSSGCVPNSLQATVQEKATYSAVDLGYNTTDFSVLTGTGATTKSLRMSMQNGAFPGKSLTVDLSSNLAGKAAGNMIVFSDNIDTLDIKLNGYNGANGLDASQICATRILANQYGSDVRVKFLQRRAGNDPAFKADRCAQADVNDIQSSKFTCNDPAYTALDPLDPKINVTRIRKVARCQSIIPQNICYQRSYDISCNYHVFIRPFNTWYEGMVASVSNNIQCSCPGGWDDCQPNHRAYAPNSQNPISPYNQNWFWRNSVATPVYATLNRRLNQQQLQELLGAYSDMNGICRHYANDDYELNWIKTNEAHIMAHQQGRERHSSDPGNIYTGCGGPTNHYEEYGGSGSFSWEVTGFSGPSVTGPGLDFTGERLEGGSAFSDSTSGSKGQTNSAGWKLEIMPAFYQGCNQYFSFITTQTSNIIKSLYDPNQFNNLASYCINPADPTNCSINSPYCDDPSSSVNCHKVSACEQINKKYCLDVNDRTNCSQPPYCDDPNSSVNCSASEVSKSCDPTDPLNSFCDKDPNNLGQYQFIGNEPDPFKNQESFDCRSSSCIAQYKSVEQSYNLDVITPTTGQDGTIPGQGLFFINDVRAITQQSVPGQAGAGGKSDISSLPEVRYCATKRDATTDPNTKFENDPEIIFRRVNWKAFDIKSGGQPGAFPPFTNNKVELYKKLDPATRYLLKKELL